MSCDKDRLRMQLNVWMIGFIQAAQICDYIHQKIHHKSS